MAIIGNITLSFLLLLVTHKPVQAMDSASMPDAVEKLLGHQLTTNFYFRYKYEGPPTICNLILTSYQIQDPETFYGKFNQQFNIFTARENRSLIEDLVLSGKIIDTRFLSDSDFENSLLQHFPELTDLSNLLGKILRSDDVPFKNKFEWVLSTIHFNSHPYLAMLSIQKMSLLLDIDAAGRESSVEAESQRLAIKHLMALVAFRRYVPLSYELGSRSLAADYLILVKKYAYNFDFFVPTIFEQFKTIFYKSTLANIYDDEYWFRIVLEVTNGSQIQIGTNLLLDVSNKVIMLRHSPRPKRDNAEALLFMIVNHLNHRGYFKEKTLVELKQMVKSGPSGAESVGALIQLARMIPKVPIVYFDQLDLILKGAIYKTSRQHINGQKLGFPYLDED